MKALILQTKQKKIVVMIMSNTDDWTNEDREELDDYNSDNNSNDDWRASPDYDFSKN